MDNDAKIRPFYISKMLYEQTDDDHYLTTAQICEQLKTEYGMDTHRSTIGSDIDLLQKTGMDIKCVKSTQNRYNIVSRRFDIPELKLLIDAVESAKFITQEKSDELVEKLMSMASQYEAEQLKRNLVVDGRIKSNNSRVYLIIDAINEAINKKKKISFQMTEYNIRKEKILHNHGEIYVFSPYSLIWDGDNYYVVGYSEKHQGIGSHRVDRIYRQPQILQDDIEPQPKDFDINEYVNTMFRMYDSPRCEVELICHNSLMDAIIDKFGPDVTTYACDQENFRVVVNVAVSHVFYSWVFGFKGLVKIKNPEFICREYDRMLH